MKKNSLILLCAFISIAAYAQPAVDNVIFNLQTYPGGYNIPCKGGTVDINPILIGGAPPYSYTWYNGNGNVISNSLDLSNAHAGDYRLRLTKAGWSGDFDVKLLEPEALGLELSPSQYEDGYQIRSNGGNDGYVKAEVYGGNPPYSYLWSNGQNREVIENLTAGTYSLTITDAGGCQTTKSIALVEPSLLHVTSISSPQHNGYNVSYNGGSDGAINLSVTGGSPPYKYQWSNGNIEKDIDKLSARSYSVIVTDANQASIVKSITLTEPAKMDFSLSPLVYPNGFNLSCYDCNNGKITTIVTGGVPPYSYQWSNGQTIAIISGLEAKDYSVKITDANGMITERAVSLRAPARDDWSMTGNANISASQFVGTSDNNDFSIRTNNVERLRIKNSGQINLSSDLKLNGVTGTNYQTAVIDPNGIIGQRPSLGGRGTCSIPIDGWFNCVLPDDISHCIGNVGIQNSNPLENLHIGLQFTFRDDPVNSIIGHNFFYGNSPGRRIQDGKASTILMGKEGDIVFSVAPDGIASSTINDWDWKFVRIINNGNVGIGNRDPKENLHIGQQLTLRDDPTNSIIGHNFYYGSAPSRRINQGKSSTILMGQQGDIVFSVAPDGIANSTINDWDWKIVRITNEGKVGIGVADPKENLQVGQQLTIRDDPTNSIIGHNFFYGNSPGRRINSGKASTILLGQDGDIVFSVAPNGAANSTILQNEWKTMRINNDGKVLIGDCHPPAGDVYNLYVRGGIRTEEVKVDLANGHWADYVFNHNYNLRSIDELSDYIKTNKHLPAIPTESEVCENGINVSEVSAQLLAKIEELTLYVIQLNEKNNELNKKYDELLKTK